VRREAQLQRFIAVGAMYDQFGDHGVVEYTYLCPHSKALLYTQAGAKT